MPSVADVYGKPTTRAAKYKSNFGGLAKQYDWLLEYYSQDPAKSPQIALYKELIDDVSRDISAIERQIRENREEQIDFTTRRQEKNAGYLNSAARLAYTADRADARTEFTQEQAAARARQYNARKLSASRAEGRLAPDDNLKRAGQDAYTASGGNIVAGFEQLDGTIQGSRELAKDESSVDGSNYTLFSSYVAAKKQELAADPDFSALTQPELDQMARDSVLAAVPPQYKQSVERHKQKIDDQTAAGIPDAEKEVGDLTGDQIAEIGGMSTSLLGTAPPDSMKEEQTRLESELAAKRTELGGFRDAYNQAITTRAQDPVGQARQAFLDAYFPGTRPAFEQNRLLELASLQTPQDRDALLAGFREFQQTQPTRRPGLLERADLFYRTPGGLLDRLMPGMDADPRAGRMPTSTPPLPFGRRMSREQFKEYLQSIPSDRQEEGGIPYERKVEMMKAYDATFGPEDPTIQREGPRMAGDVIGGVGSPFAQPEMELDRTDYFEGVSPGAREYIGKRPSPQMLERILSPESPESIENIQSQGLTIDFSDPDNPRYIQLSRAGAVIDQAFRSDQIPVPEADLAEPMSRRERVEDSRLQVGISKYQELKKRRALLEQAKAKAAGEQIAIIAEGEKLLDEAISAQVDALNNLERAKEKNLDDETMAVMQRAADDAASTADEVLQITSDANLNLDRVLGAELDEDVAARQERQDIEAVEAGVREDEYGDLPLDKPLDRRAVQRTPQSLQQKDTEVKGQAYIEALRLVKEDNGRAFTALLGTPIGIEVADLYKANEAKGDQNNEELLSYLAKEFPSSADQKKAAQVIFGLDITKIESEYMGKDEESPLKPLYSQAGLDIGSTVEAPDVPEEPVDTAPIGD